MERKYKKIYEFKQIVKKQTEYQIAKNRYNDTSIIGNELHELSEKLGFEFARKNYKGNFIPKYDIRLVYIAYGLSKGKQYIQIEQPKERNILSSFDWSYINQMKDHFTESISEVENE